ncbi:MAG: LysR family transcriptional regulator [Pseudoruegeria sp.]
MDNWDEIRTAFQVARRGTVSGAAEELGVHHATVIRHIDALEARLGAKLFQRHARGYTATEAGQDLLQVAQATDDQFAQLAGRIKGQGEGIHGELIITTLPFFSPLLAPVLVEFQRQNPDIIVRLIADARVFRLEYGEAHVAIRAGQAPDEPDNVVQPFYKHDMGLYAHKDYIAEHGMPQSDTDLSSHRFIGGDNIDSPAPFLKWMKDNVPRENVMFRIGGLDTSIVPIMSGAGIGFTSVWEASKHPELVEVLPPRPEWSANGWIVTHVDLHRTAKVQSFLKLLKQRVKEWPCTGK